MTLGAEVGQHGFQNQADQFQWALNEFGGESRWLMRLDADEYLEDGSHVDNSIRELLDKPDDAIYMRLFDMWSEDAYREDDLWKAHKYFRPFLVRPHALKLATWPRMNQHCGRFPREATHLPYVCSHARIQHLGWSSEQDRKAKHERYMKLDPDGRLGSLPQYRSILDESPRLMSWSGTSEGSRL